MTEESFQQARKVMATANNLRGLITKQKGEVAKWTALEDAYRRDFKQGQAEGAKKCLTKALEKLETLKGKFDLLTFPDSNIVVVKKKASCGICGIPTNQANGYCPQCLMEEPTKKRQ